MTRADKFALAGLLAYLFVGLWDWGYYIAVYGDINQTGPMAHFFGWVPALFWPLHIIVRVWEAVL